MAEETIFLRRFSSNAAVPARSRRYTLKRLRVKPTDP